MSDDVYDGKPKKMNLGERFHLWDYAEGYCHPCEIHVSGDDSCKACREWLMYGKPGFPQRCSCGGLIHYARSWFETSDDAYQCDTMQCDQCGQKGFGNGNFHRADFDR